MSGASDSERNATMTNQERAKKLAGIFGWKTETCFSGCVHAHTPFGIVEPEYLIDDDSGLLPWLLSELATRGMYPSVKYLDCWVGEVVCGIPWTAKSHCPLLALVDATIAAHAGGAK